LQRLHRLHRGVGTQGKVFFCPLQRVLFMQGRAVIQIRSFDVDAEGLISFTLHDSL
jgi:hypothetical protein